MALCLCGQQPENSVRQPPVTHSGKRREAPGDAVNRVTVHSEGPDLPAGSSDSTEESLITGLWEDLFGFSPIGMQDDFFQLGGTSLHAARLVARIRTLTGRDLPLESLLYAPTIERLALLMRAGDRVSSSTLVLLR